MIAVSVLCSVQVVGQQNPGKHVWQNGETMCQFSQI